MRPFASWRGWMFRFFDQLYLDCIHELLAQWEVNLSRKRGVGIRNQGGEFHSVTKMEYSTGAMVDPEQIKSSVKLKEVRDAGSNLVRGRFKIPFEGELIREGYPHLYSPLLSSPNIYIYIYIVI